MTVTTPPTKWDAGKIVAEFGPFKVIDRQRETELINEGKSNHIYTIMVVDVDYDDLPESEKPSEEELEQRGETKDEFSMGMQYGAVGRHIVNMQEIYESSKPLPDELDLEDEDIWFGEDGFPTP